MEYEVTDTQPDDHVEYMVAILSAYDQAVTTLAGEYECGHNANNCRPLLHRHVRRLRALVMHHLTRK